MAVLESIVALVEVRPRLFPIVLTDDKEFQTGKSFMCRSWKEYQDTLDGWHAQILANKSGQLFHELLLADKRFADNVENMLSVLCGKVSRTEITSCVCQFLEDI